MMMTVMMMVLLLYGFLHVVVAVIVVGCSPTIRFTTTIITAAGMCMPGMRCVNLWLAVRYQEWPWQVDGYSISLETVGCREQNSNVKSKSRQQTLPKMYNPPPPQIQIQIQKPATPSIPMSRTITRTPPDHYLSRHRYSIWTDGWWYRCHVSILDCRCDLFFIVRFIPNVVKVIAVGALEWQSCQFIDPPLWSPNVFVIFIPTCLENMPIGPTIYINCINTLWITLTE